MNSVILHLHNLQDNGIDLSKNHNVLLSRTLLLDDNALPVHHNVHPNHTRPSVWCCTDVFEASTQTDITPAVSACQQILALTLKAESIQLKVIHLFTEKSKLKSIEKVITEYRHQNLHQILQPSSLAYIEGAARLWPPSQKLMMMLQSLIPWKFSTPRL